MSQSQQIRVFNGITGRWMKLSVETDANGQLDKEKIEQELKKRSRALNDADLELDIVKVDIPANVDFIVPAATVKEIEDRKKLKKERRIKRELEIQMKY